jgi:hypothetical protein
VQECSGDLTFYSGGGVKTHWRWRRQRFNLEGKGGAGGGGPERVVAQAGQGDEVASKKVLGTTDCALPVRPRVHGPFGISWA